MTHIPCRSTLGRNSVLLIGTLILLVSAGRPSASGQAQKIDLLRIGTTNVLIDNVEPGSEDTAKDSFKKFIKSETGFVNEIYQMDSYTAVGERLADGQLHLGVLMGYEFAWAQAKQPKLKPLAVSVNTYPYRYVHVLVHKDSKAADFAGLQGHALALPRIGLPYMRLFVDRQSQAAGKTAETFFSKLTTLDNIEAVLDQVVDGMTQAAVVDRVGLEAYKRRKPGRFAQLKEVARSEALPPALVAYHEGKLDAATLKRLQDGLINAHKKKTGQLLLDSYRLTSFQTAPDDLDRVLADTLKRYPPPPAKEK